MKLKLMLTALMVTALVPNFAQDSEAGILVARRGAQLGNVWQKYAGISWAIGGGAELIRTAAGWRECACDNSPFSTAEKTIGYIIGTTFLVLDGGSDEATRSRIETSVAAVMGAEVSHPAVQALSQEIANRASNVQEGQEIVLDEATVQNHLRSIEDSISPAAYARALELFTKAS
jgi:hypothetical protein